jgi:malate dehydrogenase (oxaloacetate-decarboxylating)(NADP+)
MYVFPGIGLGAILCKSVNVTQDMIYASGSYLSEALNKEEKADNYLYPDVSRIREVSVVVTRGVIRAAQKNGVDRELALRHLSDEQLDDYIRHRMYDPFHEGELLKGEVKDLSKRSNGVSDAAQEVVDSVRGAVAGAHL